MSTQFESGAPAAHGLIPLSVPEIRGREWEYVKECLDTGWVSSVGSFVDRFERMVADYVGMRHAVATVNGTAALHVALLVAGVQPDDEVLVSDLTFIAPANAVRYAGAWPVFVDAEPDYWQMDPHIVREFLVNGCRLSGGELRNKKTGRRVSAILPVHILGHPCDMDPIMELARQYDLVVIEDATESLGAKYLSGDQRLQTTDHRPQTEDRRSDEARDGRQAPVSVPATKNEEPRTENWKRCGSIADIACFSFNGNKIITTGGGGMIVTDRADWAEKARYLTTQAKDDPVEYIHGHIGYNYRLTNVQAAIGCAQMESLDAYVEAKRNIAATYRKELAGVPGMAIFPDAPWAFSNAWMATVLVTAAEYGLDSRHLMQALSKQGIQTRPLWQPLHRSPAHRGAQALGGSVSEELQMNALSLPCSVGLTLEQQKMVVNRLLESRVSERTV